MIEKKTCCILVRENEATEMAMVESAKLHDVMIKIVIVITSNVTPRNK